MLLLFGTMSISGALRADARMWNPTPQSQALDYTQIIHTRADHNTLIVWWIASPLLPGGKQVQEVIDPYVIFGVVEGRAEPNGVMQFTPIDSIYPSDSNEAPLHQLLDNDIPPAIRGFITTLQGTFAQTIGAMGHNMQWFTFDAGQVKPCAKGRLSVRVAGVTYTYDTPIPGCP